MSKIEFHGIAFIDEENHTSYIIDAKEYDDLIMSGNKGEAIYRIGKDNPGMSYELRNALVTAYEYRVKDWESENKKPQPFLISIFSPDKKPLNLGKDKDIYWIVEYSPTFWHWPIILPAKINYKDRSIAEFVTNRMAAKDFDLEKLEDKKYFYEQLTEFLDKREGAKNVLPFSTASENSKNKGV